jgi:hypothetical protein
MGRRTSALQIIAKYGMTPVNKSARAVVRPSADKRREVVSVTIEEGRTPPVSKPIVRRAKCSICGCSVRKDHLKSHMEVAHNPNRWMNCSICGCPLKIRQKKRHMMKAHKVQA